MSATYQKIETTSKARAESLRELWTRMNLAVRNIAEAEGAWQCEYCGDWTTSEVETTIEDTHGQIWTEVQCPRCSGSR